MGAAKHQKDERQPLPTRFCLATRPIEVNAKTVQAADEMMQLSNNLRR
jgi:hypothetical protein